MADGRRHLPHPGRRSGDRPWRTRVDAWRGHLAAFLQRRRTGPLGRFARYVRLADLIALFATGLALVAINNVQEGRRASIGAICAAVSATSDQGRKVIGSARPLPPRMEALFVRLGYPSEAERRRLAQQAARAYVAGISRLVDQKIGNAGVGVVRPDGTLNCARLEVIARTR